jgi:hypothetical protein
MCFGVVPWHTLAVSMSQFPEAEVIRTERKQRSRNKAHAQAAARPHCPRHGRRVIPLLLLLPPLPGLISWNLPKSSFPWTKVELIPFQAG